MERFRVDLRLHRATVEAEPPRGLLIAASLRVDERAVAAEEIVGGERPGADRGGEVLGAVPRRALRTVLAPDEHVPDALLELTDVARPRVLVPEVVGDPRLDLGGQR